MPLWHFLYTNAECIFRFSLLISSYFIIYYFRIRIRIRIHIRIHIRIRMVAHSSLEIEKPMLLYKSESKEY